MFFATSLDWVKFFKLLLRYWYVFSLKSSLCTTSALHKKETRLPCFTQVIVIDFISILSATLLRVCNLHCILGIDCLLSKLHSRCGPLSYGNTNPQVVVSVWKTVTESHTQRWLLQQSQLSVHQLQAVIMSSGFSLVWCSPKDVAKCIVMVLAALTQVG